MNTNLGPNAQTLHYYNLSRAQQSSPTSSPSRSPHQSYNQSPESQPSPQPSPQHTIQLQFDRLCAQIYQHGQLIDNMMQDISHLSVVQPIKYRKDGNNGQMVMHDGLDVMNFYPRFGLDCQYVDDEEKKMLVFSDRNFNNMLSSMEKFNAKLKQQLKGYYFQYSKTTLLTQKLLSQNHTLRSILTSTNKSLHSLLTHLHKSATQHNPHLQSLSHQLSTHKEQNGVLREHYKKLKEKKKLRQQEEKELIDVVEGKNREKYGLEIKCREYDDLEDNMGKCVVLERGNRGEVELRERYLLAQKDRLKKLLQQYTTDRKCLQEQTTQTTSTKTYHLQKTMPTLLSYTLQHSQSLQTLQQTEQQYKAKLKQLGDAQQQLRDNENKVSQYSMMGRKLDKKISQYMAQLQNKQANRQKLFVQQVELASNSQVLTFQTSQLTTKLQHKQTQLHKQSQQNQQQLKTYQKLRIDQMQRWNLQALKSKKTNNVSLMNQNHALNLQQIQIENLSIRIKECGQYVQGLLGKVRDIKQRQHNVNSMRDQVYSVQRGNQVYVQQQQTLPQFITHMQPIQMQHMQMQPIQIQHMQEVSPQVQIQATQMQVPQQMQSMQVPTQVQMQGTSQRKGGVSVVNKKQLSTPLFYPIQSTQTRPNYSINPQSVQPTNFMQRGSQLQSRLHLQSRLDLQQAKSTPRTQMQTQRSPAQNQPISSPRSTRQPIYLKSSRSPQPTRSQYQK